MVSQLLDSDGRLGGGMSQLLQRIVYRMRLQIRPCTVLRKWGWRMLGTQVGAGTSIPHCRMTWPHQVAIGTNCMLEENIIFKFDGIWQPGPSIVIGNTVFIGTGCEFNIRKRITVENDVLISAGCRFIDHDHGIPPRDQFIGPYPGPEEPITLEENAWLGVNVVVLKGVTIGRGAVVGAGAVVTRSIPPFEIWAGIPARKIGERPQS